MLKHKLISAPAGSGKTRELVKRYIELIKLGYEPRNIVAITYTNKAASEMKERVFRELAERYPEKWKEYRKNLQDFRISTIHSFFASLLRRVAIELDLDPEFDILPSNHVLEDLMNMAVEKTFQEMLRSPEAALLERLIKDFSYKNLIRFLKQRLRRFVLFFDVAEEKGKVEPDIFYMSGQLTLSIARNGLRDPVSIRVFEEQVVAAVSKVFLRVLKRFSEMKNELGYLHFDDFEYYIYRALKEQDYDINSILLYFNEHVKHLLIDEFQDTSYQQWKIIRELIDEWFAGKGIKEVFDSSLFIVGDPKQSIYRFRGAEVENFTEVKELFEERISTPEGRKYFDKPEERKVNHRSLSSILDYVNELFCRIWEDYQPVKGSRRGKGSVEVIRIPAQKRKTEKKEVEADIVVSKIFEILSSPDRYRVYDRQEEGWRAPRLSDIAILFRQKTHMDIFERKLREAGIRYISERGTGFFEKPETNFLNNLAGFLATGDRRFLIPLLSTSVFGFEGSEVVDFLKGKQVKNDKLRFVMEAAERKDLEPLSSVLYRLCEQLELFRYFSLPSERANIEKFLGLLEKEEATTGLIWKDLFSSMRAYEEEKEGEYVIPGYQDCLRLLTVHLAKGLEFPIVFVTGAEEFFQRPHRRDSNIAVLLKNDMALKIPLLQKRLRGSERELLKYENLKRKDLDKEQEESERVLYVALTRARDHLIVSYIEDEKVENIELLSETARKLGFPVSEGATGVLFKLDLEEEEEPVQEFLEPLSDVNFIREERASSEVSPSVYLDRQRYEALRFGTALHRILQELGEGRLKPEQVRQRAAQLYSNPDALVEHVRKLEQAGLLEEVVLYPNSLNEFPLTLVDSLSITKAKVDKILFKDGEIWIVDYKTDQEDPASIVEKYRSQLQVYVKVARLFWKKPVKGYLLLTHHARLERVI